MGDWKCIKKTHLVNSVLVDLSFFGIFYLIFDIPYAFDSWAHCPNKKYRQTFAEDDVHRL